MRKINIYYKILRSKSFLYILFRCCYEAKRKLGILSKKYPTDLKIVNIPSLCDWRKNEFCWFFNSKESLSFPKERSQTLKESMGHILRGDVFYFSKTWKSLGLEYDWVTNPETGFRYDAHQHWTQVEDFSSEAGDIKFVWEKSRFSWLLTICRYDYHFEEDHAGFVIGQIEDWIEKNPLNCGPNYKCSQEISIRILNWLFALNFYRNSDALVEDKYTKIMTSIYWQTDHVMKNINFSRIAVRNNHAITETLTLYLMGLMFPMMPDAVVWRKKGKKYFEQEILYQFEDDGSYLQNSMNYQRVVTQLLTLGIAITNKHGERFSEIIYQRAYANINFLYQMQDETTGWLPNYGSNDGALFFPLSDNDYCDYRPQIDALYSILTGKHLYCMAFEDSSWFGECPTIKMTNIKRQEGLVQFKKSGYFIFREKSCFTIIRCGSYKGIVGQIDLQTIDIWFNGENVLLDGGSYKYNTDEQTIRYFAGTESHNTVMLGDNDQMCKGPRFMWFYPVSIRNAEVHETGDEYVYNGSVECFKHIGRGIIHNRIIRKTKNINEWVVVDEVINKPVNLSIRQLWHTCSNNIFFKSDGVLKETQGSYSRYYGKKEHSRQYEFECNNNKISTIISIQ